MDRTEWKNSWAANNPDEYRRYQREYRQKRKLEDAEFRQRTARHSFNARPNKESSTEFTWTEHIPPEVLESFKNQLICEICGVEFGPGVPKCLDHNHITKTARGTLCKKCNVGLGYFFDDINNLENAVSYLKRTGS